jgi:hypothetical protein
VGVADESVRSLPAPALRPFIAYYSGYRQAGIEPGRHRGLPSPYLTLPHLAREFRALAGCTPASWLAEEFRNVQSGLDGLVPGSPHE